MSKIVKTDIRFRIGSFIALLYARIRYGRNSDICDFCWMPIPAGQLKYATDINLKIGKKYKQMQICIPCGHKR